MANRRSDPVHRWLVWRTADEAARDYLYRGIEETGISDTARHFSRETFGLRFAGPGSIVEVQVIRNYPPLRTRKAASIFLASKGEESFS